MSPAINCAGMCELAHRPACLLSNLQLSSGSNADINRISTRMSMFSHMAWRDRVSHWLVIPVLLVAGVAVSSCGGDSTGQASTGSAATQVETGSVPLYDASTQLLTLPQLRMGDSILTDVKLNLKSQGTWAVVSKGAKGFRVNLIDIDRIVGEIGGKASPTLDSGVAIRRTVTVLLSR
ncbi:MAG: hypothetical protein H7322_01385 [Ramlibacter sp.]|nr:hypothetical protein [Ramlibacter sp.]